MEERGRYDVQSNGEPNGAQQSDFPLYEYIRLNMLLNRVPADDTFEVFYRQCKHLMKQIKDTGVLPDDRNDNIILCISKRSWDFEYISHSLRLLGGELTKEKLYEWLVSQGNGEEMDQHSGCPVCATSAPSAPSPTPSTSLSGERQTQTPSQATTEPNQAHPSNIFTNEGRFATCQSIIHNTQKKIIHLRQEQFNDIYLEFKQLCEISYGVTKGEMPRLLIGYRDPARAVQLHKAISAFPSEIPIPGLAKTIEILTKAGIEVLLIFLDIVTVFGNYQENNSRERAMAREGDMMKKVYAAKEAEWKRFDVQIAGLESTISRFEKEIELIKQGKKWDTEAQKEMLETEKEKTEKLIKEMMKKEREKCDAIGCACVEKERLGNLIAPGLGTRTRDDVDRKKIVEILNGGEPWKEQNSDALFEEFREQQFGRNRRGRRY